MSAKSYPATIHGQFMAWLAQALRQVLTFLILFASLIALLWVLDSRHGLSLMGTSYTRIPETMSVAEDPVRTVRAATPADEARFRALSEFLARRYRVSQDRTYDLVGIAHAVGRDLGLDPLLIISVIAIESRFNPIAESGVGAKGLMQIMPGMHRDKLEEFGGEKAVYDPKANIIVGAQILKEYFQRTGNLGIALQMYAGALSDDSDAYSNRVFGEKERLQAVVERFAKSTPVNTRVGARPAAAPSSPL